MADLKVCLLGSPEITRSGDPVNFTRKKSLALFVYLLLSNCPLSRDFLTHLLYPQCPRDRGKSNLRHIVSVTKQDLDRDMLRCEGDFLSLTSSIPIDLDITRLLALNRISCEFTESSETELITETVEELLLLYRGDFLNGFYLTDCFDFEQWQYSYGDDLYGMYRDIMKRAIGILELRGCLPRAIEYARLLLLKDHLDESVHRILIRLYHRCGRNHEALRQFSLCKKIIAEDMLDDLQEETCRLYTSIMSEDEDFIETDHPNRIDLTGIDVYAGKPFIGREENLLCLRTVFGSKDTRLLQITGAPGIGKTRTAIESAMMSCHLFPGGIYFFDLSTVSEPECLMRLVDGRQEMDSCSRHCKVASSVRSVNDALPVLLIFDNLDNLSVGSIDTIPRPGRNRTIILIRREPLPWNIEDVRIHPMTLPDRDEHLKIGKTLLLYDAIHFFIDRALNARFDLSITGSILPVIERICVRLGGNPLAIEIAAGCLKEMSLTDLGENIPEYSGNGKDSLYDTPNTAEPLRSIIEWMYGRLGKKERMFLSCLSTLGTVCTMDDLDRVFPACGTEDQREGLTLLESLVCRGVVSRVEKRDTNLFTVPGPLREYILDELKKRV